MGASMSDSILKQQLGVATPFQRLKLALKRHDDVREELGLLEQIYETLMAPPEEPIRATKTNPLGQPLRATLSVGGATFEISAEDSKAYVRERIVCLTEELEALSRKLSDTAAHQLGS